MASEHEEADPGNATGVPRLNIATVLLWTAVSAGLLVLHDPIDLVPSKYRALSAVNQVVHSLFGGAGIVAFLLLVRCRNRSVAFPLAIGHWFLFAYATLTALLIGWYLWDERLMHVQWIQFYVGLVSLAPVAILVWAMRSQPMHLIWKATVVAMILSHLSVSIQFFTTPSLEQPVDNFIVVGLVVIAVISDVVSEEDYDWLHWVGVASVLTSQIMELTYWLTD